MIDSEKKKNLQLAYLKKYKSQTDIPFFNDLSNEIRANAIDLIVFSDQDDIRYREIAL